MSSSRPFLITDSSYPCVWLNGLQNPSDQFRTVLGTISKIKNPALEQLQESKEDEMDGDVIASSPLVTKVRANSMSIKENYNKSDLNSEVFTGKLNEPSSMLKLVGFTFLKTTSYC